jgi:hypothetical protein
MKYYLLFFSFLICLLVQAQPPAQNNSLNFQFNSNQVLEEKNSTMVLDSMVYQKEALEEKSVKSKTSLERERSESASFSKKQVVSKSFAQLKKSASSQPQSRSIESSMQEALDQKVMELQADSTAEFEYNLFYYMAGNYDVERAPFLQKAAELSPNNTDVLIQSMANSIIIGDTTDAKKYLMKLKAEEQISEEGLSYAADVLLSSADYNTLITYGFLDTYCVLYEQIVNKNSNQIPVISLDFLQSQHYRTALTKLGYAIPEQREVNVAFLESFCAANQDKNLALSLTIPSPYFVPLQSNLVPFGLIFEVQSSKDLPSLKTLQTQEDLWRTMNKKNITKFKSPLSNNLSSNYLPMLFYLESEYDLNIVKYAKVDTKSYIQEIGLKSGKSAIINKKH